MLTGHSTIENENTGRITVVTRCPFCRRQNSVNVNATEYRQWQNGALIQQAFKTLNAAQRELLLTGICDDCWPD